MPTSQGNRLCPQCRRIVPAGRCRECKRRADRERGSPASRGYGRGWAKRRFAYLVANPLCVECEAEGVIRLATVADHWPRSRRELVEADVDDPDADEHLRSLCKRHHDISTAERQPGGYRKRDGPVG